MSDEQRMQEQFERVYARRYGPRSLRRDENGGYAKLSTFEAWANFWRGFRARDAEVQALREALRKIAWLDTGENSSHSDALDALTKIEVIAFAALAGESGDSE